MSACSPWAPGVLMGSAGLAGHVIILVAGLLEGVELLRERLDEP